MEIRRLYAALFATIALPVQAAEWRSAYTEIDFSQCTIISGYELGASFACPGYKGYPLMIAEGDLRMFVSYGFGALEERAASQTFAPFNALGPRIEWLLRDDPEWGEMPVGTILRVFVAAAAFEDPDHQVLVVTRIEPGNTCQVAHIDALANRNANQMARDAAAAFIGTFDCSADDIVRVGDWSLD